MIYNICLNKYFNNLKDIILAIFKILNTYSYVLKMELKRIQNKNILQITSLNMTIYRLKVFNKLLTYQNRN